MHGTGDVSMKIDTFEFEFSPSVYENGNFNDLTYHINTLNIKVLANDIYVKHLSFGIIPNFIAKPVANLVIHHCQGAIDSFTKIAANLVKEVLEKHRHDIPDMVEIPDTTVSASLSFPSEPKLYNDRIEIPFDGSIFVTTEGYNPQKDHAKTIMPSSNQDDQNNVQFFVHEHMLVSDFETVKKSGLKFSLDSAWAEQFGLPDDIFTVKYFNMLFPFMTCQYNSDVKIRIELSLDTTLPTDVNFVEGGMAGRMSPNLKFYADEELAITVRFTAGFTADINFQVKDKGSYAHGVLKTVELSSVGYDKGTVEYCDLPAIVQNFENKSEDLLKQASDAILEQGVYIPAIPLFNGLFEVDLEMIFMELKDTYLYTSFTLDIHNRIQMLKALRNNKNMFKATTTLEQLLKLKSPAEQCFGSN